MTFSKNLWTFSGRYKSRDLQKAEANRDPRSDGDATLGLVVEAAEQRVVVPQRFNQIPECEFRRLIPGRAPRIFNVYVNVASLRLHLRTLVLLYPHAKLIVTDDEGAAMACVTERLHKAGPGPFQSIGLSRYDG